MQIHQNRHEFIAEWTNLGNALADRLFVEVDEPAKCAKLRSLITGEVRRLTDDGYTAHSINRELCVKFKKRRAEMTSSELTEVLGYLKGMKLANVQPQTDLPPLRTRMKRNERGMHVDAIIQAAFNYLRRRDPVGHITRDDVLGACIPRISRQALERSIYRRKWDIVTATEARRLNKAETVKTTTEPTHMTTSQDKEAFENIRTVLAKSKTRAYSSVVLVSKLAKLGVKQPAVKVLNAIADGLLTRNVQGQLELTNTP